MSDRNDEPHPLDLPEEDKVVYELGEWPLDLQAAAAEALAESEIPHTFDGTDLVVHVDWEESVDELLDEVEQAAGGVVVSVDLDEVDGVAPPPPPPEGDIVYELDDWTEDQRELLADRLGRQDIPYRWEDETSLVVLAADEARTELVLDEVEFPEGTDLAAVQAELDAEDTAQDEGADDDAQATDDDDADDDDDEDDDEDDEDDNVDPDEALAAAEETSFEALSLLYLAADRLKGNPLDVDGLADLTQAIEDANPDVPPYGITPGLWHNAVERANTLADAVTDEEADRTGEAVDVATALRNLLRPYV